MQGPGLDPDPFIARALAYAPRLHADQFFSHETVFGLIGAPTPDWPRRLGLHVATHRPSREPRVHGVCGHRFQTRESAAVTDARGLRFEHPVRAWRQAGATWTFDDLVAAADFLVSGDRPWATVDDLRREIEIMGDVRHGLLRSALGAVRGGVRSPRETRLRLMLVRAGLPEPAIGWNLYDANGTFVAELDMAYVRYRVAPEYDGRVHAFDDRQFAKDADRWDAIRGQGWDHVRVLNHHMQHGGSAAVRKVGDALLRAGWRPGAL